MGPNQFTLPEVVAIVFLIGFAIQQARLTLLEHIK